MLFSKRIEVAKEVDAWFDLCDKELTSGHKVSRGVFGVITALQVLGYLREDKELNGDKEEE